MVARQTSLKLGDCVNAETRVWGDQWVQSVHGTDWKDGRTYGKVIRIEGRCEVALRLCGEGREPRELATQHFAL